LCLLGLQPSQYTSLSESGHFMKEEVALSHCSSKAEVQQLLNSQEQLEAVFGE